MGISDTVETLLTQFQRLEEIVYYVIPALVGLFMILWGIFLNDGDWLLIGAGLAVLLIAGWYLVQAIRGR
jgi:hypothetical protein